jgi:hypothetical protein
MGDRDMTDNISRNRFGDTYCLILSILMIVSALIEPPQGWWRVLIHAVLPVTLFMIFAWRLIKAGKR